VTARGWVKQKESCVRRPVRRRKLGGGLVGVWGGGGVGWGTQTAMEGLRGGGEKRLKQFLLGVTSGMLGLGGPGISQKKKKYGGLDQGTLVGMSNGVQNGLLGGGVWTGFNRGVEVGYTFYCITAIQPRLKQKGKPTRSGK